MAALIAAAGAGNAPFRFTHFLLPLEQIMTRAIHAAYAAAAYAVFLATILYLIGFVADFPMLSKTIDSGPLSDPLTSWIVNVALIGLFGIQHSVMARQGFKRMWTRIVPVPIERATYVLIASLMLILLVWQWRPLPAIVWSTATPLAEMLLVLSLIGWGLVFLSTFLINHFELFGLRQVYARLRGRELPAPEFRTPLLYKHVRHPLYLGFLIAFWAAPVMTVGHLLFAVGMTTYILVAIAFEERDLIATFGERYRAYKAQVPMLFPSFVRRSTAAAARDGGPSR